MNVKRNMLSPPRLVGFGFIAFSLLSFRARGIQGMGEEGEGEERREKENHNPHGVVGFFSWIVASA
jgi:hypothetical protein